MTSQTVSKIALRRLTDSVLAKIADDTYRRNRVCEFRCVIRFLVVVLMLPIYAQAVQVKTSEHDQALITEARGGYGVAIESWSNVLRMIASRRGLCGAGFFTGGNLRS